MNTTSSAAQLIHPLVLSGGSGTRLWPLSRSLHPKQLLPIATDSSMLRETLARVTGQETFGASIIVGGENHALLIARETEGQALAPHGILLEPEGRNTAAAIAMAAHHALALWGGDPLLLVMPSDHVIADPASFRDAVLAGAQAARAGKLVTFGIEPTAPETGYGYIAVGDAIAGADRVHAVERFVEKPDRETALGYLESGRYLWNGGIFLFGARSFLDELARLAPAVAASCTAAMAASTAEGAFTRPEATAFRACPNISVDYAVMERTDKAAVVPVDMGWSDVGSWQALWSISDKNPAGNVVKGQVVAIDCKDSLLRVEGGAPIAAVGLDDMVVVSMRDALLIAPKDRAQDVKAIVDELKASGQDTHARQAVVHRSWGTVETHDNRHGFTTRHFVVDPGCTMPSPPSVPRHWIVMSGTAQITIDGDVEALEADRSAYAATDATAEIANPGATPLHVIEVTASAGRSG